jgi:hypothetical protein
METATFHSHGEFRFTIPLPWPIPDLVRVKYRMDMWTTFTWSNGFNVAMLSGLYGDTDYEYPYYIDEGDSQFEMDQDWDSDVEVSFTALVWLFPEFYYFSYPINMWIRLEVPGYVYGGGFGFHRWWIHEE